MRRAFLAFCLTACIAAPAAAQAAFEDAGAAAAMMAKACIPDSLDFDALFANAKDVIEGEGLPVVMSDDKAAMYGNPGTAHITVSRRIDSLHCSLNIPAPNGSKEYFATLRDAYGAAIEAVYPGALSDSMESASPHEAGHQWLWRKTRDRHFAVSLDWQADRGVSLNMGYSQKYD